MRIGLLRHFKVNCPHKRMMTSREFREWNDKYHESEVIKTKVDMNGIEWDVCYVSDLPRAVATAKTVYKGHILVDKLLREVENEPFIHNDRLKLPFEVWHTFGRLAWFLRAKSQPETILDTRNRINRFLDKVDWSKDNVLIVFHGFMLYNFQKELKKRGFTGPNLKKVKNGTLYEYNREIVKEDIVDENLSNMCG